MRTKEEAAFAFTPAGKLPPGHVQRIMRTEILFKDTVSELMELVPESADRTAAMRKLLEAKMTCVQAISHDKSVPVQNPPTVEAPKENENVKSEKQEKNRR